MDNFHERQAAASLSTLQDRDSWPDSPVFSAGMPVEFTCIAAGASLTCLGFSYPTGEPSPPVAPAAANSKDKRPAEASKAEPKSEKKTKEQLREEAENYITRSHQKILRSFLGTRCRPESRSSTQVDDLLKGLREQTQAPVFATILANYKEVWLPTI